MPEESRSFDLDVALTRVAGDQELLREVAGIYLDNYESMLQGVGDAVAARDAATLKAAAHLMKGTVASFEARIAMVASAALEDMGREDRLETAPAALAELESAVHQLAEDLSAYRAEAC